MRVAKIWTAIMALAVCAVGALQAGTITTSSLTNNESDIVNLGTPVISAVNFGSTQGGTMSVDINGINHEVASAANNGTGADLLSGVAINSTFDGHYRTGQATASGYTGDMQNLMSGIAGRAAPGPIELDISGLTVGQDYLFQGYWEANNFNQTASVTFEGTDTLGGISGDGTLGVLISYEFTASDTMLDADLTHTGGTDNIWWLGYSLQEQVAVPEPGTCVMWSVLGLGFAVFGLSRSRRRRS